MDYKNRSLNVFGTKYQIKFVDRIRPNEENNLTYGECDSTRRTISISLKDTDNKPIPDNIVKTSLLHEVIHAILNEGQYSGASSDEPMVELLAKCFMDIIYKQKLI